MFTPEGLLEQWGYVAVLAGATLGNIGLPVPEKSLLLVAGYLAAAGHLHPVSVATLGILGALLGAGLAYAAGRRWGGRVRRWPATPRPAVPHVETATGLIQRYGAVGVFVGRFLPGMRMLSGASAALLGVRPVAFLLAVLCSTAYVPLLVAVGYAVGR